MAVCEEIVADEMHEAGKSSLDAAEERAKAAGAIIERHGTGVRVSMPPLRGSAILAPWQWAVLAIIGFRQWLHWGETRSLLQLDTFVFAALAIYILLTYWRRRIVTVNETEVAIGYSGGRNLFWAKRWPRTAIGEIRVNPENGNLLIRVTGVDRKDFRISGDRVTTQAIADILENARERCALASSGKNA